MNALLIFPHERTGISSAVITADRAAYVAERHELAPGLRLTVIEWGGRLGHGVVRNVAPAHVELDELVLDQPAPPRAHIELICAVPRPQTVRKLLQLCGTMGVTALHLVRSVNVVKSYLSSKALLPEQITSELVMAMEQARDPVPPRIEIHSSFRHFVGRELGPYMGAHPERLCLLADTASGAARPLAAAVTSPAAACFAAIGPESGWSVGERQAFTALGFQPVTLGPRMLRVETAATAIVAQLQLLLEQAGAAYLDNAPFTPWRGL